MSPKPLTGGVYRQGSLHQAHFINPTGKFNIVSRLIYLPKSYTMALSDGAPSNTISLASAVNFTFHNSHIFTTAPLSETSLSSMNSLGSQATAMVSVEQPVCICAPLAHSGGSPGLCHAFCLCFMAAGGCCHSFLFAPLVPRKPPQGFPTP